MTGFPRTKAVFVLNLETLYPLLKQIMQVHKIEKARQVNFAEYYLREHVPHLSKVRKAILSLMTPLIFAEMANLMMRISATTVRQYNIPAEALQQAYDHNPDYHQMIAESFADTVALCWELGLTNTRSKGASRLLEAKLQRGVFTS